MKSKRSLMTVLVGLAMLATPITAAAFDNNNYAHDNARNNSRPAHVSRSSNAPARSFAATRNATSAAVTRREFRNNAAGLAADRGWREDRNAWNRPLGTAGEYRDYGNPGYYRAPAYVAATPYYGAPGYAGGSACRQAQSIMYNYYRDRNTGHPAAAADLLAQNQWAFRSGGCGGVAPATGGLFSGLGRVPAYNNYGGYNSGYGQPYGSSSTLAPLIQQFIR